MSSEQDAITKIMNQYITREKKSKEIGLYLIKSRGILMLDEVEATYKEAEKL